ncbi:hypothetical protein G3T14_17340 [Methylobacterium sp. BTF04]|uniref:hypothetical protein n=1 Tax=Methylobacterium sp. BTF04 TaxID=2708300 RepID=UPI0013CF9C68|nr:hypothetical protein [Methylobacterium sp. BTF04]NEU13877.1 hypothetical protein [Methylobacterium sp. BTF04]
MSEPARQYPNHDAVARPQPGPLRDWLAAMKAATSGQPAAEIEEPVAEIAPPAQNWTPRVVARPVPKGADAVEEDVSDLMAENLMLKAKLHVEADRYDALQEVLAQELRSLRAHVEDEMRELDEVRAERDRLNEVQARFMTDLRDVRAKMEAEAEVLKDVRAERDLWIARAEALAQPLFQKR